MAKKVFNMQGGLHSAAAYAGLENRAYGSCVASPTSFVVTPGAGMNLSISSGDGLISVDAFLARRIQVTATESAAVSAANASFNRLDTVVAYIDTGVAPTTAVIDNVNDVLKFKVVPGTAAATPAAPTGAAIQASIGAGNPYMVLYDVLVPQGAVNVAGVTLTDRRVLLAAPAVADGIVSTNKLANLAVTTAKIANKAVNVDKFDYSVLPAFKAKRVGAQNSGVNSAIDAVFDTEYYDLTNAYNPATGLFTAPYDCLMAFACAFFVEGVATNRAFISSRGTAATTAPNSVERMADQIQGSGGALNRIGAVYETKMLAGQTFGVSLWTSAAGSIAHQDTWFAGHLIAKL